MTYPTVIYRWKLWKGNYRRMTVVLSFGIDWQKKVRLLVRLSTKPVRLTTLVLPSKEASMFTHNESDQIFYWFLSFCSLPNQVYRRAVKKGFEFTLMVVGESGLGKSTLINSMFLADIYSPEYPGPSHRIKKTVQVCLFFFFFFWLVITS